MTKREYVKEFTSAAEHWPEFDNFVQAGGVPGCRIPCGVSTNELAAWFYDLDNTIGADRCHDPRVVNAMNWDTGFRDTRWVRLTPADAIETMREEDEAYSPDW